MEQRGVPRYGVTPLIQGRRGHLDGSQTAESPAQIVAPSTSFGRFQLTQDAASSQLANQRPALIFTPILFKWIPASIQLSQRTLLGLEDQIKGSSVPFDA